MNTVNAPRFTWNTPSAMGHAPVSGYNVYWGTSSSGTTITSSISSNTYSPSVITDPTVEKYLRLQTVNESGINSMWVTAFTYKFDNAAPNTMPVITETHGAISGQDVYDETPSFTWTVPFTSGAPVVGYSIYWGTNPAGEAPANYQTATSFTPSAITQNAVHYLRMRLKDAAGNYSAWNTVFEYKYSAEQITKYYNLGPVTGMSSNGVYYTLVSDQVSSTALVVNASGNKVAETRYYPFGEERYTSGTSPTDKTYTGQRSEDFGLMDYNARFYSPYLNQFTQPDTIISDPYNVLDWNRYAYARNNPILYNDPDGHHPIIPIIAIAVVFALNISRDSTHIEGTSANALVTNAIVRGYDPIDWLWTTYDCLFGNCSSSDVFFAMAPILNGSIDDAFDATRQVVKNGDEIVDIGASYLNNYEEYYGVTRAAGQFQVHHIFPQKFRTVMLEAGINIDDPRFLREIQSLPGVENFHQKYFTNAWENWSRDLGHAATAEEIIDFAKSLETKYIAEFGTTFYRSGEGLPGKINWEELNR